MFYGKEAGVPQPVSFNGSFIFWNPDSLSTDYVIWVHSDLGNDIKPDSLLPTLFRTVKLDAIIDDKYFRENGTRIYLCQYPTEDVKKDYISRMAALKKEFSRL